MERGEENLEALTRELREDLGIELQSAREVFRHNHRHLDQTDVELTFFRVEGYRGAVSNRVFHRILWAEVGELKTFDFLDGDLPLIEMLVRQELPL